MKVQMSPYTKLMAFAAVHTERNCTPAPPKPDVVLQPWTLNVPPFSRAGSLLVQVADYQ